MTWNSNPVTIRGVNYPSERQAARALNLAPSVIRRALERGTQDRCGLNLRGQKPCTVEGVEYPSRIAASVATGINYKTLCKRIRK